MNGQLLNTVTEHKDLGVIISSNLKVADHCHYARSKANKMLGLEWSNALLNIEIFNSYGSAL